VFEVEEAKGGKSDERTSDMGGLVAVMLLYRLVDSYFKDKQND